MSFGNNSDAPTIASDGDTRGESWDYTGSKGAEGVWQKIISEIPPHETWVEAFAGSGIITRRKKPAVCSLVIDADAGLCRRWQSVPVPGLTVVCADAVEWLSLWTPSGAAVVYCDPPYLMETRTSQRNYYRKEFASVEQHSALLHVLSYLPCPVLLSGYRSALYDERLKDWRRIDYRVSAHGSARTESLWCNFPAPATLHDGRFVGSNFRERERLKRLRQRWQARIGRLSREERIILAELLRT